MKYKITFKNSVSRDLSKIDKTQVKNILDKIESELGENANKYPVLSGKFSGLHKFRVGDYRVIYTIINDSVLVLRIGHRREIYRWFTLITLDLISTGT